MVLLGGYYGVAMVFAMVVARWLLWCCYGIARCLLWCCYGVARWLLGVARCCSCIARWLLLCC